MDSWWRFGHYYYNHCWVMLPVTNWCRITQRSTVGNAPTSPRVHGFSNVEGANIKTHPTYYMGWSSNNLAKIHGGFKWKFQILLVLYYTPSLSSIGKDRSTAKLCDFSHQVDRFPVSFPLNQSNDMWVQPRLDQNSKPERTDVFLMCNIKTSFWGLPLFWTHTQICPKH